MELVSVPGPVSQGCLCHVPAPAKPGLGCPLNVKAVGLLPLELCLRGRVRAELQPSWRAGVEVLEDAFRMQGGGERNY